MERKKKSNEKITHQVKKEFHRTNVMLYKNNIYRTTK